MILEITEFNRLFNLIEKVKGFCRGQLTRNLKSNQKTNPVYFVSELVNHNESEIGWTVS